MKLKREYYSELEAALTKDYENFSGLSQKKKDAIMAEAARLDKAEKPVINPQKVFKFTDYTLLADKIADYMKFNLVAESDKESGWIEFKGKEIWFPIGTYADIKDMFTELVQNADDIRIYHKDGFTVVHLLYVFM